MRDNVNAPPEAYLPGKWFPPVPPSKNSNYDTDMSARAIAPQEP